MCLLPSLSDAMKDVAEKRVFGESSSATATLPNPSELNNNTESVSASPISTVSETGPKAVTDLGVVGRGVKRTTEKSANDNDPIASKRRNLDDRLGNSSSTSGFQ
jgi:hypothetical protein